MRTIETSQVIVLALLGGLAAAQEEPVEKSKEKQERNIIITASRLEESARDVGSSATVVSSQDLDRAQHRRVLDALREVPALDVVQTGSAGGKTSVFLRGANSEHTLVLVDGVEANDAISSGRSFDFAHLTGDNVDRIEVIRGPQSVLHGSDALGGVINIITRRGRGEPTLKLLTEGGSFGTYRGSASVSGGSDLVHYSLGASRTQTSGISSASKDEAGNSERDGYRNATFSTRIGVTPEDYFEIDFSARYTSARVEIDNGGGAGQDDPNHVLDFGQWLFKAEPRLVLCNGLWEQALGLSLAEVAREDDNPPDSANPGELTFSSFDSQVADLDWQHNFFVHESNTLTIGGEFEEDQGESFFHSDGAFGPFTSVFDKQTAWTRSAYAQDRVQLWDRLTATAGVRIDDHKEFGTHATYRLTSAYRLEPTGTKLRGTIGTGFKAPSLFQLFSSFGDPKLEPEESLGWDAGVDQELLGDLAVISLTYFRNTFEELILFDGGLSRFVNVGRAVTQGVEATARVRPLETLEVTISYSFTATEDKSTGEDLLRRPRHKGGVRATWFAADSASISVSALYVGDRDDNDFSTFPATRVTLDDYWLANLSLSYRIFEDVELFGRVENVFDQEYEEVFGFGVPGAAGYVGAAVSF